MWDMANSVLHHFQTLQESLEHQWTKCYSAWWQIKKIFSGVRKETRQVCRVLPAVASPGTLISACGILPLGLKRLCMLWWPILMLLKWEINQNLALKCIEGSEFTAKRVPHGLLKRTGRMAFNRCQLSSTLLHHFPPQQHWEGEDGSR